MLGKRAKIITWDVRRGDWCCVGYINVYFRSCFRSSKQLYVSLLTPPPNSCSEVAIFVIHLCRYSSNVPLLQAAQCFISSIMISFTDSKSWLRYASLNIYGQGGGCSMRWYYHLVRYAWKINLDGVFWWCGLKLIYICIELLFGHTSLI